MRMVDGTVGMDYYHLSDGPRKPQSKLVGAGELVAADQRPAPPGTDDGASLAGAAAPGSGGNYGRCSAKRSDMCARRVSP